MDMCYEGALVMPSSYAVMDEEEMTYVEGGGTITVKASADTVRTICRSGAALIGTAVGMAFGGPILAQLLSGCITTIIYDAIIDICGVKYKSFNWSKTADWIPNCILNLNKYV